MGPAYPRQDQLMRQDEIVPKWASFVVGSAFLALSVLALANLMLGAAPPVRFIGTMMALAAVAQLLHAMLLTGWGGFHAWLFSGALFGAAGIIALYDPRLASVTSVIGLVLALGASGILRIRTGLRLRPQAGWKWLTLSGGITIATGAVVALGWPVEHAALFGAVLAADLIAQGIAATAFGLALRPD